MSGDAVRAAGCGAPVQNGVLPASVDLETETVVRGQVVDSGGAGVPGAYVRLLDAQGEFTAEVVAGDEGGFCFFAAPGSWTLRALSRAGDGSQLVQTARGWNEFTVAVAR